MFTCQYPFNISSIHRMVSDVLLIYTSGLSEASSRRKVRQYKETFTMSCNGSQYLYPFNSLSFDMCLRT